VGQFHVNSSGLASWIDHTLNVNFKLTHYLRGRDRARTFPIIHDITRLEHSRGRCPSCPGVCLPRALPQAFLRHFSTGHDDVSPAALVCVITGLFF
jgi:hypothetical protein